MNQHRRQATTPKRCRDLHRVDLNAFNADLSSTLRDQSSDGDINVEALMISLTNIILDTLNIHAPVKMKSAKYSRPCPWLTEELIMKVRERKKLHRQLTRNPTNEALRENHRRARATARKPDRMLRNAYFTQQCSGTSDQRKLWAIMNCVTGRSKKRHTPKASLDDLSQVFGDIVTDPNRPPELQPPSGPLSRSSFTVLKPVAIADIAKCLGAVDPYKATGSDGVPGPSSLCRHHSPTLGDGN